MMGSLIGRLMAKGGKWSFVQGDLAEVTEEFKNPARGWYQIYTFEIEKEPDFEELKWCLNTQDALALVLIDIGSYRRKDLDEAGLERIRVILRFFESYGYDCIVRVVYDHEGKALVREPAEFTQVKTHLKQVSGVIRQCASSVFIFQGMLLGNWGEMHGSRFLDDIRMSQLAEVLRREKDPQTFLAVRRPVYWRRLHKGQKPGALDCSDGMGLFDDGIFGSASHMGTFDEEERKDQEWDKPWCREQELDFENKLCRQAPNGGETVYSSGFIRTLTPKKVIEELGRMQITYLNRAHDTKMLDTWKEWKYPGSGVWAGKSVFDYAGAHLGYRFLARNVRVARVNRGSGQYRVEVEIGNTGFGGFYQDGEIYLEYMDRYGEKSAVVAESRMRGWRSGEVRRLSCMVETGGGEIYLAAKRKHDGARIVFANPSDKEGRTLLGHLKTEH
jgi:hypothetical protein